MARRLIHPLEHCRLFLHAGFPIPIKIMSHLMPTMSTKRQPCRTLPQMWIKILRSTLAYMVVEKFVDSKEWFGEAIITSHSHLKELNTSHEYTPALYVKIFLAKPKDIQVNKVCTIIDGLKNNILWTGNGHNHVNDIHLNLLVTCYVMTFWRYTWGRCTRSMGGST